MDYHFPMPIRVKKLLKKVFSEVFFFYSSQLHKYA